jgi:hypothetical protein
MPAKTALSGPVFRIVIFCRLFQALFGGRFIPRYLAPVVDDPPSAGHLAELFMPGMAG